MRDVLARVVATKGPNMFPLILAAALALPNAALTPGAVRPLTKQVICSTKWGLDRRAVTVKMKQQVFAAYGIPWADRAKYEVDHRESRDIGGADRVDNLWPQPLFEAKHYKDPLETKLNRLICNGTISVATAQQALRDDWTRAYQQYVGPLPDR